MPADDDVKACVCILASATYLPCVSKTFLSDSMQTSNDNCTSLITRKKKMKLSLFIFLARRESVIINEMQQSYHNSNQVEKMKRNSSKRRIKTNCSARWLHGSSLRPSIQLNFGIVARKFEKSLSNMNE